MSVLGDQLHHHRAREAALKRYRRPDDPEVIAAVAARRYAAAEQAIAREAEADPPLTAEQKARLAILLLQPRVGG